MQPMAYLLRLNARVVTPTDSLVNHPDNFRFFRPRKNWAEKERKLSIRRPTDFYRTISLNVIHKDEILPKMLQFFLGNGTK